MKYAAALWLFLLWRSFAATAQVLPTSGGSCGVGSSGIMSCAWFTAVPLRRGDGDRSNNAAPDDRPQIFVTRFTLAHGAPLGALVEGREGLIIGMGDGELVNETKSPPIHISVGNGTALLMLKDEHYLLRNIGTQDLELLVVDIRREPSQPTTVDKSAFH